MQSYVLYKIEGVDFVQSPQNNLPMQSDQSPSFQPLYMQIKQLVMRSLDAGEWKPGEAIPSENELALRYKVSQGTVRKAIDALATEHIVVRRQGKGTFVATHTEERSSMFRFLRMRSNDGIDEYPKSRLLDLRRLKATADVARLLVLKPGEAVVSLRRVLEFAGAPVVLDEITVQAALFKGLTRARFYAYHGSIYSFFETGFGVRMLRADERLTAIAADPASASILDVAIGTPLLAVDRVAYTYGDRPVEVRRGLCRTDAHHYLNQLG